MYAYLNGTLAEKNPATAVIDCGGVGYLLKIPISTYDQLPAIGQPAKLLTHLAVGDDHQTLYGFSTSDEKKLFQLLIGISGIGPSIAINIISGTTPEALRDMILAEDEGRIKKLKGIGPKSAKRMIVELKPIFESMSFGSVQELTPANQTIQDAQLALISLGYNRTSAFKAIQKAVDDLGETASVDALIKKGLSYTS